jgi:hypothetical protein
MTKGQPMDQLTGNFARPQSIRRQHAIKGILYMIDTAGGHAITPEAQDEIIKNQLRQENYEYEPKTGGRAQKYNVQKIRALMAKLAHESKLKTTVQGEDKVTLLFRRQSQALDPIILAKCGYKRGDALTVMQQQSFQVFEGSTARPAGREGRGVSRNSPLIPNALQKLRTCHDERAFLLVLQDIDASRSERNEPHYRYNTRQARTSALHEICNRFRLTTSGEMESTRLLDGNALYDIVYRLWSDHKPHQWVRFDSLWREGSQNLKPDQLRRLKLSCAQFDSKEHVSAFDTTATDTCIEQDLVTKSSSVSPPLPHSNDESILSTPSETFRGSDLTSTRFDSGKKHSRGLKRKASSDTFQEASIRSPVVFVPQNESSGTVRRAVRDAGAHTKRLSVELQHLAPSNASHEMENIFNAQKTDVLEMIESLGFTQCSCPLTPRPSRELLPLYQRCWGDDWKQGGNTLLMGGKRSVLDDTTALISAFLFEHILTGAAPPARDTVDNSEDDGMYNLHQKLPPGTHRSRYLELDVVTPSRKQSALLSQLSQTHVRAITAEFFCSLNPYFSSLTQLSRMMYSDRAEEDLDLAPFRGAMSEIITKVLSLRSRLDASGMEAMFFWPTRGEIYDSECMQAPVMLALSTSLNYVVAFTTFPGLTYADPTVGVVYKACVVLRVEAAK